MVSISFHIEKVIFQECSYPTEHTNRPEIQAIFPTRTFAQYSRLTKTCSKIQANDPHMEELVLY